ncbi:CapA family protein [Rhodococcus maanshanensis]|uniref:Poly-gamma-glutamate synthesis protein (Capsule biosynthesis protein) n=1 Tax=Rhodococcus maanshanensis TaxID=183556 RepID=A0A1H7XML3_9NOCA|nr:CapA family protein [Rhodococcus maanshanensis]SEM34864.1 poly-gamma-glutamate synthesis protein (capsule biosynthesis protein) [Rhodococcus maanshanensis]
MAETITLFLSGDVMTGRGVDQILPCPGSPALRERCASDAREYVTLAERVNGKIAAPVDWDWPWGEALMVLDESEPDLRVINLETAVTTSDDYAPKGINYRMHPSNVGVLTAADIDVCVLANNHILDFGIRGLEETLRTLRRAGVRHAGAGRTARQAWAPVAVHTTAGRALIWSMGAESSGVSPRDAARGGRPGLALLADMSTSGADAVVKRMLRARREGDLLVASVHWGSNWGFGVPGAQVRFAHRLVDGGVDIVHGHSSHHPRPVEIYRGRPILYGCGDLINDYEGIGGYERFRDDLRPLYLVTLDARSHELRELRIVPMQSRRMRLRRASAADTRWLRGVLDGLGRDFGTRVDPGGGGALVARPDRGRE